MQGWRISMEDAHIAILDLLHGKPEAKDHAQKLSFFGVFDGHGGDKVALYTGEHIHDIIANQETFKAGKYEQALKDGFLATDRAILNGTPLQAAPRYLRRMRGTWLTNFFKTDPKYEEEVSGCTACVGLLTDDKIYVVRTHHLLRCTALS